MPERLQFTEIKEVFPNFSYKDYEECRNLRRSSFLEASSSPELNGGIPNLIIDNQGSPEEIITVKPKAKPTFFGRIKKYVRKVWRAIKKIKLSYKK